MLSAAAIATSFLGGQALRDGDPSGWSWLAILLFGGLGTVTLLILWPTRDWEFAAIPRRLIATYIETDTPLPAAQIHRDLALHMEDSYRVNERRLERLVLYFRIASVLLTVEVVTWIIDLASRA